MAWAWIDQSWVPRPWELKVKAELLTSDFAHARLLGVREGIEQKSKVWKKVIVNRTAEMKSWAKYLRARALVPKTFIFANNHYQGYAPDTVEHRSAEVAATRHETRPPFHGDQPQ